MIRKARAADVDAICDLIHGYARKLLLLPRTRMSIIEALPLFRVATEEGRVVGCAALHVLWDDLAEVRSLAIDAGAQGKGYGRQLVEALVEEAREMGIARVMAFTYQESFFAKCGFHVVKKESLPQKVWKDCVNCAKFSHCDEIAMIRYVSIAPGEEVLSPVPAQDEGLA